MEIKVQAPQEIKVDFGEVDKLEASNCLVYKKDKTLHVHGGDSAWRESAIISTCGFVFLLLVIVFEKI